MIKIVNYFLQSLFIYFFFLIGRIFGLKVSRIIFANLFSFIGPYFKSKKVIEDNLNIFLKKYPKFDRKKISSIMWKNYGMTFIEYSFLNYFKKNNSHINIKNENELQKI